MTKIIITIDIENSDNSDIDTSDLKIFTGTLNENTIVKKKRNRNKTKIIKKVDNTKELNDKINIVIPIYKNKNYND